MKSIRPLHGIDKFRRAGRFRQRDAKRSFGGELRTELQLAMLTAANPSLFAKSATTYAHRAFTHGSWFHFSFCVRNGGRWQLGFSFRREIARRLGNKRRQGGIQSR